MPVMINSLFIEIYCTNIVYTCNKVQFISYSICCYNNCLYFLYIVFIIQISSSYYIISAPYNTLMLFFAFIIIQLFDFIQLMLEIKNIS